jgi:hypothetical protein
MMTEDGRMFFGGMPEICPTMLSYKYTGAYEMPIRELL